MRREKRAYPALISVIIPTLDDERALVETLASLVPGAAEGLVVEAIVVDGGSRDGTAVVADAAGCKFVASSGSRGRRYAEGATIAKAEWLLFLLPGVALDEGWTRDARHFLETVTRRRASATAAGAFRSGSDGFGLSARFGETLTDIGARLGFGSSAHQGLILSKPLYRALGGHLDNDSPERALSRRLPASRLLLLKSRATRIGEH